jgi:hypothetical protein
VGHGPTTIPVRARVRRSGVELSRALAANWTALNETLVGISIELNLACAASPECMHLTTFP